LDGSPVAGWLWVYAAILFRSGGFCAKVHTVRQREARKVGLGILIGDGEA
jgi:hypothetical protein